jgi:hypothetical protein
MPHLGLIASLGLLWYSLMTDNELTVFVAVILMIIFAALADA